MCLALPTYVDFALYCPYSLLLLRLSSCSTNVTFSGSLPILCPVILQLFVFWVVDIRFLSEGISYAILISVSSCIIHIVNVVKGRQPELLRTKCHWSMSVEGDVRQSLMTLTFLCIMSGMMLYYRRSFCYQSSMIFRCFGILSLHRIGYFTFIGREKRSNRPTKVSLHWTGFKFGIYSQKLHAQLLQDAKSRLFVFDKIIH